MLELKNAGKQFNNQWLFRNLNLVAQPGDFISVLGPSGCGKSTLLRILAGLDTLSEGQLAGSLSQTPGFVFQEACLLPWLSVFENVKIGFQDSSITDSQKKDLILQILAIVKLSKWTDYFPYQLSGGMRMRVSIARALVNQKSVLFMDEPFAALDDFTRFELQEELLEYWRNHRMTVFFVTHSVMESVFLSQKLWLFPQGANLEFSEHTLNKGSVDPAKYRKSESYFQLFNSISENLRVQK